MALKPPTDPAKDFVQSLLEDKFDLALGKQVQAHLIKKGLETERSYYSPEDAFLSLEVGVTEAFIHLGISHDDPSTRDTPRRFAAMVVGELTKGLNYSFFPKCTATPNGASAGLDPKYIELHGVQGGYNQMVLVRDIQTMSLCEHHLQTIDGVTHIAYIPSTKVLGLSKFARVTDFFARRPQIQERMTDQIYEALHVILETEDIAVVQDATHYCMRARGAMQSQARTQTNKLGGRFLSKPALRQEFFDAIRR